MMKERTQVSERTKRRLHAKTAREAALDILVRVEQDRSYSNLLLNRTLQEQPLSRQDAALATELVYGTIQRLNTIDYFLATFVRSGLAKLQPWVRSLLRLSFYQLHYLDRIPPHAAVNEAVNLARKRGHQGIAGMVNAVLRAVLRSRSELVIPPDLSATERISLLHSHPEWLVSRWIRQYGEALTERICAAHHIAPAVSVRANAIRTSRDQLLTLLRDEGIDAAPSPLAPQGILIHGAGNMAHTTWYRDGWLSIQDESSMLVAEIMNPSPGMRVLDCCAAPGGKTTHLAERMGGSGEVVAVDLHEHKIRLIEEQAARLRLDCIQAVVGDAARLAAELPAESFDCLLLDAPCSGLGVIRRKPELKWTKSEQDIAAICAIQRELLDQVQRLLKPGGIFVYSTCTITAEENEQAVESFLRRQPQFEPDYATVPGLPPDVNEALAARGQVQILPCDYGSDGFFIARMRKKENV